MAGSSPARSVYIVGAGIAGLTLALALAKFGVTVVVLERNASIAEVGAGLQVGPNARKVLNRLGLDLAVAAQSLNPTGIDLYAFRSGRPMQTLELGAAMTERFGASYAVMHRGDLAEVLYAACRKFANIDINFGVRSFDAVQHSRGLSVEIEEANGRIRTARPFALIGADGINSAVRTRVLAGEPARYDGSTAWRALLDLDALGGAVSLERVSVVMGPGYHAVCYPLPYRRRINVALFTKEKASRAGGAPLARDPKLPWAALKSPRFDTIMVAAEGNWGAWPLGTVAAERWHDGAIGLMGDAAHAMMPFQAQGAAMAIEDAAVLAPLLAQEETAATALAQFEAIRRPRVTRVQAVSARNGGIFHMEWPWSVARNAVIRLEGPRGHMRRLKWLYGHDVQGETPRLR